MAEKVFCGMILVAGVVPRDTGLQTFTNASSPSIPCYRQFPLSGGCTGSRLPNGSGVAQSRTGLKIPETREPPEVDGSRLQLAYSLGRGCSPEALSLLAQAPCEKLRSSCSIIVVVSVQSETAPSARQSQNTHLLMLVAILKILSH